MKGDMDRECRAAGGKITADHRKKVKKAFYSDAPTGETPDATLERGKGPLFRKAGGKVDGKGKKPHAGRAGRARGGGVGSDLHPLTSSGDPSKPKGRSIMGDGDRTP